MAETQADMSQDRALDALVAMSRKYGSDPEFCIAGGGNTSVKIDDRLHVKASGSALGEITLAGFVELDRKALAGIVDTDFGQDEEAREARFKSAVMSARIHPELGQRPSVECVLHELIPGRFVAHTHSTVVNMLTCAKLGEEIAKELFGDRIIWLPYTTPGYILAKAVSDALRAYHDRHPAQPPLAVIMGNHGLIVSGDSPEEIDEKTYEVVSAVEAQIGEIPDEPFGPIAETEFDDALDLINIISPALRGLLSEPGDPLKFVTLIDSEYASDLSDGAEGHDVAMGGPLTPDQIVYCKAFPLWLEASPDEPEEDIVHRLNEAVKKYHNKHGFKPHVVIVKGIGILAAGDTYKAATTVADVYNDAIKIMAGARNLGGVQYMTKHDREFIERWEVEQYRRKEAQKSAPKGRVQNKVAFITGAAQGFGREIAESLVNEGAFVIMTDINEEGVAFEADQLGEYNAVGLPVDVTNEMSMVFTINEAVAIAGGIDIFISNAGVLRAESVKDQTLEDFLFVTDVNYAAYFVGVKHVAPIMARQHYERRDLWFDIIQINSKSGLEGSNKNAAYAGSKFGGIGLTQSFALELIADGIKVNAVCPGNFLDGPLWSDPEKGLFVQYLEAGKVPGAKTIDDVRKHYESRVPMGRGCTTADVMKAVYYIIDQAYETGQAIPVTGGQTMLR